MRHSLVQELRCPACAGSLDTDARIRDGAISEGFLLCTSCAGVFPILGGIPVLVADARAYVASRPSLGRRLYHDSSFSAIRGFIKESLAGATVHDISVSERRWCGIYRRARCSALYSEINRIMESLGAAGRILEHGCSIGITAMNEARRGGSVYGIDISLDALQEAASAVPGGDFVVADSLAHPFGTARFERVIALNMLEITEPADLLQLVAAQAEKNIIIGDPYDYERGTRSVAHPYDGAMVRRRLREYGFDITCGTGEPAQIPWRLQINERARLEYSVDIIVAARDASRT